MIDDEDFRNAIRLYLEFHWEKFSNIPASIKYHHTETGGQLIHVLEVLEIGLGIIELIGWQGEVNKSSYVAAALLHDIGKIDRYQWNSFHKCWEYSDKATHLNSGIVMVDRGDHCLYPILDFPIITGFPLPKDVALAILSHMGGFSATSVKPDTLMETILASADYISSRLNR